MAVSISLSRGVDTAPCSLQRVGGMLVADPGGKGRGRLQPGVSGPYPDRNISPMSLCGPEISGPDSDVVVCS